MKIWVQDFSKRPFVRNVATVATGTAASQAIALVFSPIIARQYGPEVYGLQGVFMSVVVLLTTVAALGYPTAIVLPKLDADALGIARLSIYIGLGMALLTTIALFFFGADMLRLLNSEAISAFVYLIPVAMFISVVSGVLGQWLIRKKAYLLTAKYGVFTTLLLNSVKTSLGVINPTAMVLIVTNTAGGLLGSALTYIGWRKLLAKQPVMEKISQPSATLGQLARRHRDFPLLRTPQNLINTFSQSLPMLLLASYFGTSAAGQYAIAISVLGMPSGLIGGSVMAVFYPRINDAIRNGENARALIIKATTGMALTGGLPFLIVMVAGPFLFEFVFGGKWYTAGVYAQWLSPWLFLQYVNKPAVSAIPALRLQGGLLVYELFSTATKLLALWLGYIVFGNEVTAIILFSLFGVVAYAWLILWVIRRSGKPQQLEHTQGLNMNEKKQVDKAHYEFERYMSKARWNSVWHQLNEVIQLKPESVLEIGPGPGVFKHSASLFGIKVETLDLDPELAPDHVASATELPFTDNSYDVVCAFQMLEHLPYVDALRAFREMVRVSRRYVVISLPDAKIVWQYQFHIPKLGTFNKLIPRPSRGTQQHQFDGEHQWEISKKGYPLARIIRDFSEYASLLKTYRVHENPYHRFFVFQR